MVKPGLSRAIPAGLIGAIIGALLVYGIRWAQQMDPIWSPQVALVLMPWTMSALFLWGMGAFNPKMSEHAHGPDHEHADEDAPSAIIPAGDTALAHADEHHAAEPERPFAIFSSQIWVVTTLALALVVSLFAFALLPHGLLLRTTGEPFASPADFARNVEWLTPLGVQLPEGGNTFRADELSVFLGFFAFTMISLFVFAGGLAFVFYLLSKQVADARALTPTAEQLTPPAPLRAVARVSARIARGLRHGLPAFFGQKD